MVKIEQTGGRLTEEEILHGKEDAYGIYQVNRKGAGRDYAFLSFDSLRSKGKVPERTEYQLVYSDILGADENRDSLFTKFNIAHPDDFTGHSLSVSDIILIKRNGKVNVSYVDMIGFVPLPDFYKEPSLRVVEQITESTKGFTAEGHFGTWHSIQMQEFHNEKFFQMRHDEFGKQVADIIVNEQGQVIAEDLWHGFSPEAMKLIGEYLLDKSLHDKKEAAYILSADKGYFLIHETDEGYDYTFYDQEYQELDGGIYDNLDVSLKEAIEDILNDAGETIENIKETDYEKLEQEIEEAEEAGLLESVIQESKRRLQEGDVALTSEVYYEEKSLNGMSRADIEEIVLSQAQIILDELGLHDEVELIGARVYRMKTRFANFFNLPELMSVFQEVADIQTADMLRLPVPEAEYENIVLPASEEQKEILESLSERADRVRNREVDPSEDNMLKITTDGRKLALDQRLINDMLPDTENNKVSACAEKCFEIWKETKEQRSAQLIFCDSSTPKKDGTFNVYDALKEKLMQKGVPEQEIAFIHDANTDVQKAKLFTKVRSGQVRFLLGSTSKMGAGTNVQDKLIALHHLDVPWRPADIEQQEGRILRQGNQNEKVKIFRYITENTFDAYSWQLIENKQKFIGQIMTSKSPVRSCQDVDEAALSYAEVKALATGNPKIKEKMDLDIQVTKLKMLKANYESNLFRLQDAIAVEYPQQIAKYEELTAAYEADIAHLDTAMNTPFSMEIHGITYDNEKTAGEILVQACTKMKKEHTDAADIGTFKGFKMKVSYSLFDNSFYVKLTRESSVTVEVKKDPVRNIERILTALRKMPGQKDVAEERLEGARQQLVQAKEEVNKPFEKENELRSVQERLTKINAELDMKPKEEPKKMIKKEELKKCL